MDATAYRKLNLKYLCDQRSRKVISDLTGKSVVQINQLLGPVKGSNGRFGPSLAREIETGLGLQHGWLDTPHPDLYPIDESEKIREVQDTPGQYLSGQPDEENELLLVFRKLSKSGRYAVMSCAYSERLLHFSNKN